jgi:hypothetical protein
LIHILGDGKLPVCHTPPGNPDARHTILVDLPALRAHYMHGDELGYCEDETGPMSSGIDLAIVDLTDGTTTIDHYSPAGDTIIAIGPWAGSSTLEKLSTPVPVPAEPEWIAKSVADINYTGPVPGTQAFWTTGAEQDLDDGGGGSDGHGGDDDPEDDPEDDPDTGNDDNGENDGEEEVSTCDWGHLEILHLRVEFAQSNYVEDGIGDREKAELALARARRNGLVVVATSTLAGTLVGGPAGGLGGAFTSSIGAAMLEQNAIDDLALARQEEVRLKGVRDEALAEPIRYYKERNCAEVAPDHAFAPEGWMWTYVRLEFPLAHRTSMGVRSRWMHTSS